MTTRKPTGVIVPMITPFTAAGAVDAAAVGRVVEHLITGGMDGLFLLGTTGESASMTARQKRDLVAAAVEAGRGRLGIYAGISSNVQEEAVQAARDYAALGVDGLHCNAVQNGLCRLALMIGSEIEAEAGDAATAAQHHALAQLLAQNMAGLLTAPDGGWLWCINADTLQPEAAVLDAYWNRGFSGIEGVCCMQADVCGFDPSTGSWAHPAACLRTHERLASAPGRRRRVTSIFT